MALRFIDSFDHYVTADVLSKWNAQTSATISAGNGRNGTASFRATNLATQILTKFLDSQATWFVGVAFRMSAYPTTGNDTAIINLLDAGTTQVDLRVTSDGKLRATRNGTSLGLGTIVLSLSAFYYIEIKATISDASGVIVTKVNGVTDLNLSSIDTKNTANATADQVRIGPTGPALGVSWDFDDLYVCDGTGGAPTNDFLGDVRVEAILPSGNGNSSQLDGSDGNQVDNYLLVDESAPNGDTDYVESSDIGDKDTYAFGNLTPTTGTVYGVQILPYARKTDAGVRSIVSVARVSATEVDSADKTLSTSYTYYPDIRETKPGGGAWAISDVNSAEFGVKITA